jgi:chromosome segregation ATPase
MARSAKAPPAKTPDTPARKPGRPKAAPVKTSAKATKAPAAPPGRAASPAIPKPSKDELRALVEKLEATNATLRTKNREANRAAKTAAARIAELEDQVARLEQQAAPPPPAPAKTSSPKPAAPVRSKRQRRGVDPGDAVPPGVAVEEAAPLDEDAAAALENLEENLKAE